MKTVQSLRVRWSSRGGEQMGGSGRILGVAYQTIHLSSIHPSVCPLLGPAHSEPRKGRANSNDALGVLSTSAFAPNSGEPARGVTMPLSFSPAVAPGNASRLGLGLRVGVVWPERSSSSGIAGCPPTHGSFEVIECRRAYGGGDEADE
jgi:hypothetical protein